MTPPDEPDVVIVLRPLPDPAAGPGVPARDATYRLKLLLKYALRGLGFRCVSVTDAVTPAATGEGSADE